ncbi:TyrR/PhhR family helix-turn-helix DNA-binding protein [Neomoorella glycerini]|uniref:TyrR/PhhR family helix-turn-helix DNA-binding protein n=1 Tax=Neomoorella glycerini TaxID=55779 RepID=UPI001B8CE982
MRELANVLERALNLVNGPQILPEHIWFSGHGNLPVAGSSGDTPKTLAENIQAVEREIISAALAHYGSARKAARSLGLSHTALLKKMKKLKLTRLE